MNDVNSNDTKMQQNKAFLVNNDIEDVISGESVEAEVKIHKINQSTEKIRQEAMQDKIELSYVFITMILTLLFGFVEGIFLGILIKYLGDFFLKKKS